jgi:hypothetical protein
LLRQELHAKAEKIASLVAEIKDRRAAEEKITALFRRLVSMQDEERRRISRDIHDQVGQQMTALRRTLERVHRSRDGDSSQEDDLGRARKLLEDIDRSLRHETIAGGRASLGDPCDGDVQDRRVEPRRRRVLRRSARMASGFVVEEPHRLSHEDINRYSRTWEERRLSGNWKCVKTV